MPVELNVPIEPVVLRTAKVVGFKGEENEEHWLKIWVSYGKVIGSLWVEHRDPITGDKVTPTEYHLENGHHPLRHGMSLRKCVECGAWYGLEVACTVEECDGTTEPYDGFTRLGNGTPNGDTNRSVNKNAMYDFLLNEVVPDPDTGELRPLLDAVSE